MHIYLYTYTFIRRHTDTKIQLDRYRFIDTIKRKCSLLSLLYAYVLVEV